GPVTADRRHRSGHSGSSIIPELIAAGHEVTGLARSDTAAAAVSALGAKVRRSDLKDLDGLMEAAADSDGVIHVAHSEDGLGDLRGIGHVTLGEAPGERLDQDYHLDLVADHNAGPRPRR
ncbi:NAD(P)H-binding protein, partial [Actinomadura sp. 9N407]|uniref:NAD(P)H-binding protein n=1 Tax=Actinomadura sp. 9N407 TaxID=3375154 RepID=UPI00378F6F9F